MGARNDAARASANVFIHRPDTIIVGNQRCFCLDRDDRFEDFQPANVKVALYAAISAFYRFVVYCEYIVTVTLVLLSRKCRSLHGI